ncbi:MAG: bifunctional diaminohydroxyphosphoribosylaminopyrimidine deaminase/5-amino-6-(5-phosphoribosylamino)uracil reductase RibD [Cytophagales bacterium]|nr:bifunctional diaminohydroxyphosphoribosylaminopyrimidine deaminase/5-amino-6-(5-phosphoribosylamino)uracil reductase RibD [Cytophagales bacterium]
MSNEVHHEEYMRRAIELAALGLGSTSPNPLVGCVIVKEGIIIGEGYHKQYGQAHAEVNAVRSVGNPENVIGAIAYVTLEPCTFHGKTPPCTDLLIKHQVKKVVIGALDPHERVNGVGVERLRSSGIEVETGLLEEQYRHLNRRFFTFYEEKRPYIILKWATTSDGFIARKNFDSKWISNAKSRQLVHKWRSEEDAILVGKNTAKYDNPSLTVREWNGSNPTRILVDLNLELSPKGNLWDEAAPTLIFNSKIAKQEGMHEWVQVDAQQYEEELLAQLHQRKINSLIIEGGSKTLQGFIQKGLWDEARIFQSEQHFGEGIAAPEISGNLIEEKCVEKDTLKILHKG